MSKYIVEIPIAGSMSIEIEADSKSDAIGAAWERFSKSGADDFDVTWEALDAISTGNVCHAPLHRINAWECD